MPTISPTLPADGQSATAESVDNPLNTIINLLNGGLDSANIAAGGITNAALAGGIDVTKLGADALTGWTPLTQTFTYGANNGGKEFTVTAPADLTGVLSPGMRMKFTRATTPPTQCFSFVAASSQYATHASPSGLTFTGPFTAEAWIKLASYTSEPQYIVNMFNATGSTGGWFFAVDANGRLAVQYGSTTSFTSFYSSQSIPLNTWVHVAAVVTSVSGKAAQFYVNGGAVTTVSNATSATTLVQDSVDIRLGAASSTPSNTYFSGEMSEVRLWNAAQSQSAIEANMGISCAGTETNIIGLWQGNGAATDKTSNGNNLTLSGAVDNTVDNPYNATEYANILSISYSNPTSTITLKTYNYGTIPNMTLSNPYYSIDNAPFGLPGAFKRLIHSSSQIMANATATSLAQVNGLSPTLTIPNGAPRVKITVVSAAVNNSAAEPAIVTLWDGAVSTGVELQQVFPAINAATFDQTPVTLVWEGVLAAGSHTFNLSLQAFSSGTATLQAGVGFPAQMLVEDA